MAYLGRILCYLQDCFVPELILKPNERRHSGMSATFSAYNAAQFSSIHSPQQRLHGSAARIRSERRADRGATTSACYLTTSYIKIQVSRGRAPDQATRQTTVRTGCPTLTHNLLSAHFYSRCKTFYNLQNFIFIVNSIASWLVVRYHTIQKSEVNYRKSRNDYQKLDT